MPLPPDGPRIGSLFSGYGGLDEGVREVLGGRVVWHAEFAPGPSRILAHRFPTIPNYGDVTRVGLPYTDEEWEALKATAAADPDAPMPSPDWSAVEPIEVLTGGFPCQDLSLAGRRKGLHPDTRSGLWTHMAYAIDQLRPDLVVFENVRGLLSARAASDVEPDPWGLGDESAVPLRALGAVLGQLADLGYDASWQGLRAADVGAPHERFRVFGVAWPAGDPSDLVREWCRAVRGERSGGQGSAGGAGGRAAEDAEREPGDERREPAPGEAEGGGTRTDARGRGRAPAADADDDERQVRPDDGDLHRRGTEEPRRALGTAGAGRGVAASLGTPPAAPAAGREAAAEDEGPRRGAPADAGDAGLQGPGGLHPAPGEGEAAAHDRRAGGAEAPADTDRRRQRSGGRLLPDRRDADGRGRPDSDGDETEPPSREADADASSDGGGEGVAEPARLRGGPDADLRRLPADDLPADAVGRGRDGGTPLPVGEQEGGAAPGRGREGARDGRGPVEWGPFAGAIHRWEAVLGRPAPRPTSPGRTGERLDPRFVEWMMGLPAGWVTDVPELSRNEQIKALGNGVVPQQAAAALRVLLPDAAGYPV